MTRLKKLVSIWLILWSYALAEEGDDDHDEDHGHDHEDHHPDIPDGIISQPHQRLFDKLFADYRKELIPIPHPFIPLDISIEFVLRQIVNIDHDDQKFIVNAWLIWIWKDKRLTWEYDPLLRDKNMYPRVIRVNPGMLWMPDVIVSNDASGKSGIYDGMDHDELILAKVFNDGTVRWPVPVMLETTCSLNARYFPYDVQMCGVRLTSWAHDMTRINVTLRNFEGDTSWDTSEDGRWQKRQVETGKGHRYQKITGVNTNLFNTPHETWNLLMTPVTLEHVDYSVSTYERDESAIEKLEEHLGHMDDDHENHGHEVSDLQILEPAIWSEIQFNFMIQRKSGSIFFGVIVPCILFNLISIASFNVPASCGERLGITSAVLITIAVYQSIIQDMMPPSSQKQTPIMLLYITILMVMITAATILTTVILKIEFTDTVKRPNKILLRICINKYSVRFMHDVLFEDVLWDKISRLRQKIKIELIKESDQYSRGIGNLFSLNRKRAKSINLRDISVESHESSIEDLPDDKPAKIITGKGEESQDPNNKKVRISMDATTERVLSKFGTTVKQRIQTDIKKKRVERFKKNKAERLAKKSASSSTSTESDIQVQCASNALTKYQATLIKKCAQLEWKFIGRFIDRVTMVLLFLTLIAVTIWLIVYGGKNKQIEQILLDHEIIE